MQQERKVHANLVAEKVNFPVGDFVDGDFRAKKKKEYSQQSIPELPRC